MAFRLIKWIAVALTLTLACIVLSEKNLPKSNSKPDFLKSRSIRPSVRENAVTSIESTDALPPVTLHVQHDWSIDPSKTRGYVYLPLIKDNTAPVTWFTFPELPMGFSDVSIYCPGWTLNYPDPVKWSVGLNGQILVDCVDLLNQSGCRTGISAYDRLSILVYASYQNRELFQVFDPTQFIITFGGPTYGPRQLMPLESANAGVITIYPDVNKTDLALSLDLHAQNNWRSTMNSFQAIPLTDEKGFGPTTAFTWPGSAPGYAMTFQVFSKKWTHNYPDTVQWAVGINGAIVTGCHNLVDMAGCTLTVLAQDLISIFVNPVYHLAEDPSRTFIELYRETEFQFTLLKHVPYGQ